MLLILVRSNEVRSKEIESWKRVKGKVSYILLHGGVAWGLPVGLAWNILRYFFSNDYAEDPMDFFYRGIFMIVGFFLGGCLLAVWDFKKHEKQYLASDKPDNKST